MRPAAGTWRSTGSRCWAMCGAERRLTGLLRAPSTPRTWASSLARPAFGALIRTPMRDSSPRLRDVWRLTTASTPGRPKTAVPPNLTSGWRAPETR